MKTTPKAKKSIPRPIVFITSSICIAGLGAVDYYVEPRFSFLIFFLFPVCFAAWYGGKKNGIAISLLSASAWIFSDIVSTEKFAHPVIPYWNMTTTFIVFLVVSFVLSKLKRTLQLANDLARTDPITSMANKTAFSEIAGIELYRVNRYRRPFTIACLDLGDLKQFNEKFGHDAGDDALRCVAQVLNSNVRSSDLLARIGDDKFALLLTETNEDQAQSVFNKLGSSLEDAINKRNWEITYSIGVVTYIRPPATVSDMLKQADHMMYAAKREGKNRVHFLVWRESAIVR